MKNWFNPLCIVISGSFIALFLWYAYSVFILNDATVYSENGPLENIQAIVLAISTLVFLVSAVQDKSSARLILLSCSWLCFSFVLRELDVERLDVHNALKFIGAGIGRNAMLAVGFLVLLVRAVTRFSYYKKAVLLFLRSKPGILLMLGGLLLIVGDVFENSHSIIHNAFFEEIFELCGFCSILLSAFASHPALTRPAQSGRD